MFSSPEVPVFVRWGMPIIILCHIAFFLSGHFKSRSNRQHRGRTCRRKIPCRSILRVFYGSINDRYLECWSPRIGRYDFDLFWNLAIHQATDCLVLVVRPCFRFEAWFDFVVACRMVDDRYFCPCYQYRCIQVRICLFVCFASRLLCISNTTNHVRSFVIKIHRVLISSPNVTCLPEGFYDIDMMVVPLWGLYANLIAQLISQISSHFIIHYHRRIVRRAKMVNRLEHFLGDDLFRVSVDVSFVSGIKMRTRRITGSCPTR